MMFAIALIWASLKFVTIKRVNCLITGGSIRKPPPVEKKKKKEEPPPKKEEKKKEEPKPKPKPKPSDPYFAMETEDLNVS